MQKQNPAHGQSPRQLPTCSSGISPHYDLLNFHVWSFFQSPANGFPGDSMVKNLPASTGDMGLSLVWEDPTCQGVTMPVPWLLSPRATMTEARVPQSLRSTTREAAAMRSPRTTAADQRPLTTTREKSVQQWRPSNAKINNHTYIKKQNKTKA